MPLPAFRFKKFSVEQEGAAHPVGTDAVLLGAWAGLEGVQRFLDIGAGTGVVGLMLAQRLQQDFDASTSDAQLWSGVGVELHPASAALARQNYAASPWAANLELWTGAIQDFAANRATEQRGTYDLIVSNPPFFSETTLSPNQARSLGRHTATLSPQDLLIAVKTLLAPKGRFCVVLPVKEGRKLCELAVLQGLYWTRIAELHSRPGKAVERLLIQFEKSPYGIEREVFTMFASEKGDAYSAVFRALTREFYLAG